MDEILSSLEGVKRAEPNPMLYGIIKAKILVSRSIRVVSRPYVALAAACLMLLISINIRAFSQSNSSMASPSGYQVETANFNLY